MILNYIISNFLFKLGYFIFTPKNYSFGGFYGTFINGIKIANFYKKRKIICISFLDYHNKNSLRLISLGVILPGAPIQSLESIYINKVMIIKYRSLRNITS